jgi:hypothetical protein
MNWQDIGKTLASYGLPLLGAALGGPAGAAVGKLIASALDIGDATPEAIAKVLKDANRSDETAVTLRKLELDNQAYLFKITAEAETRQVEAINATMQAESKSEHWAQWGWRPYCGFCFGSAWIGDYFVLPLLHMPVPPIDPEAWLAMGAVLGVASWWRGKQKAGASE